MTNGTPPSTSVAERPGPPAKPTLTPRRAGRSPRPTPRRSTGPVRNASIHYDGIKPPSRWSWLAILLSVALHSALLLGFNRKAVVHKVVVRDDPVEQIQMMPIEDEPEDKPRELEDLDQPETASVAVPMLADIPTMMPLDSNFVQALDMTVPLKADPNAGQMLSVPVNIQRGKLDESGIKNLFNLSELDRRPEPVVQIQPEYPYEMKRQGVSARVLVRFIVDSEGNVIRPTIASATHSGFERSSLDAIVKWKFRPGMKGGRRVNTRVEQPMDYNVDTAL